MVKHIVFWNVRNDDQKKHNMEEMKKRLTALVGKVDGLISAEVGFNFKRAMILLSIRFLRTRLRLTAIRYTRIILRSRNSFIR